MIERIISGGQTGADQGGLQAALDLEIKTGGTAPKGWRTETGSNRKFLQVECGLMESISSNYWLRTEDNVKNSDGTLLVGKLHEPGTALTLRLCMEHRKPQLFIAFPDDRQRICSLLRLFIRNYNIKTLNVAGNRESKNPGIFKFTREFLVEALRSTSD